jgi:proteasome lid subunit RPN8/RPN11
VLPAIFYHFNALSSKGLEMLSTPFRLILPRQFHMEIVLQAQAELPNECCGLLAGHLESAPDGLVGRAMRRLPLVNAAASPREFDSDPRSMLIAHKEMRKENLELLAIYHSHPTSPPVPSRTDLKRNKHGESVVNLIVSLETDVPRIKAWWLGTDQYREAAVDWLE